MLEDIQIFCAIAKHQSFAKASRELGISTSVATRRLARLEHSLSTRLLNRSTRKVLLTEPGQIFYSEVLDILQTYEATKESLKSLSTTVSGTLKVVIPGALSQYCLSHQLKIFLDQYPNLKIQITPGNNLFHLLNEGYDLVISCGSLPDSSYYSKKIATMKKILCASPEYLAKYGIPKTPQELTKHNCLFVSDTYHKTWSFKQNDTVVQVIVNSNLKLTNAMDIKSIALAGVGILHLPHYMVNDSLKSGALIPILENYELKNHDMYAVYPTVKFMSNKVKLFIELIERILKHIEDKESCY